MWLSDFDRLAFEFVCVVFDSGLLIEKEKKANNRQYIKKHLVADT